MIQQKKSDNLVDGNNGMQPSPQASGPRATEDTRNCCSNFVQEVENTWRDYQYLLNPAPSMIEWNVV